MSVEAEPVDTHDREVAPGVYRFGTDQINWYVVRDGDRLAVVDAGLPAHWEQMDHLDDLGCTIDDVDALVLTHGHADHIGFAERLRQEGVPVWAHDDDRGRFASGGGSPPRDLLVNLWRPAVARYFLRVFRQGATSITPIETFHELVDGETLDVPGSPRVLSLPGHSPGHCALVLEERGVVLIGDALGTVDMRTFEPGPPQLLLVNEDRGRALNSLDRLESLEVEDEVTLLPGHGDSWHGHLADAVASARSLAR
jgi:glyoxylase-like metal-dependent hydrolase (beta-lactamase superfamily II)